ncbi:hypothetical protein TEA_021134 [Camellia sinensis var. sinensis]|uniref:Uncharacterized protein n=1 Tax=Camellia sinensis var. sinensis TaxID=542762 RepID=A0A4S4EEN1_CAMSN|nr:hypothetical protein TEA_021134 [Camellia sinensis var. sinensis]
MSISTTSSFSSPPSPPQPNDTSDGTAERRLREAEDRLREAIEELQRRQRRARRVQPPCDHADESCVANAIGNLCQSFLLSYGVRVGIGILLRAFKLARGQSYSSLLDLKVRYPIPSKTKGPVRVSSNGVKQPTKQLGVRFESVLHPIPEASWAGDYYKI